MEVFYVLHFVSKIKKHALMESVLQNILKYGLNVSFLYLVCYGRLLDFFVVYYCFIYVIIFALSLYEINQKVWTGLLALLINYL